MICDSQCHSKTKCPSQQSPVLLWRAGLFWSLWSSQSLNWMEKVLKPWMYFLMKWLLTEWVPAPTTLPLCTSSFPTLSISDFTSQALMMPCKPKAKCVAKWNYRPCKKCRTAWPWEKWVREGLKSAKPLTNEDLAWCPWATGWWWAWNLKRAIWISKVEEILEKSDS